jgi:predicted metalloprotease with PDZ domain
MRSIVRGLAIAAAAALCMGQAPAGRVEYALTPVVRDGALRSVEVALRFRGDADGETRLLLPDSWGGENELYRGVEALEVVSGASMRPGEGPAERVLTHRPGARIQVRYRVVQDWPGEPMAAQGNPYRPIIQPGYFHLIGHTVLARPHISPATPTRFRVRRLPRGWTFASDLQHRGLRLGNIEQSVTVGGDFRIVEGENARVAVRGAWRFTDAAFARDVNEIVAGQRRFWGDRTSPFLVTVVQLNAPDGWTSIGGTGLSDAFAFFASPNADPAPITRTLAHEGLHTWIPRQIGGMPDEDEAAHYWLSEGFTDFYTGRMLVRQGLWTPAEFAEDLNSTLRAYAESPVRTAPNARILADFWREQPVQQLPYQRGRLAASIWDARLRAMGRDLDDVVIEMRRRARAGDPLKAAELLPVVAASLGLDISADIASHMEEGRPILLPEDTFAPCGRVVTRQTPPFHRGFDIDATTANNNVISGVDPGLPAHAAGMRDGMVLIRRDAGEIGNAEQEIVYVVRDGERERALSYMPRGRGMLTVQRLVLDEDLEGEKLARCVAVLSGT